MAKDQLTAPVTSTVELNAKEVIAEVNITYDTLENNIEKDGLQQTLMQMLAERAAVDIEELIVNGDVASSDPYLAQLDGSGSSPSLISSMQAGSKSADSFSNRD